MRMGVRFSLLLAALFFTASAAAAQLTLVWTDKSNNEDGFRIERRTSGGSFAQIAVVAANVTSFIDSSVTAGTTYCYRVRAHNRQRVSAYTNEACGAPANLPTVTIGAANPTASEGGGAGQFLVRRTGSTAAPLTVSYAVGGTATAGSDYAALSRTVVIPAGASSAAITVRPANDPAVEPSETVAVRLVAGSAYAVGASSAATVKIVSDDKPTVTIGAVKSTATEGGGAGQFLVRRSGSTAAPLTVSYAVGGTATAGSDYAALSRTVVIPAGASSAPITVRPANDTAVEPSETVAVRLVAGSAYAVGASSAATVKIVSDDKPTVTIGAVKSTATEGGGAGQFLVRRSGSTAAPLTVSYAVGGTATAGSDYAALSRTVVIPAGASSAPITVRPANDPAVEPSETVAVRLVAGSAYAVGASSAATVKIVSDDKPTVTIGAVKSTATEGGGAGQFLVRRTGSTAAPLTVSYAVGGTATAGSDYAALSRTVVIPAGASSAAITVRPANDTAVEPSETVAVRLVAGSAYAVGASSAATVKIVSDDKPTVTIGAVKSTATEGGGAGQFLVRRTGSTAAPLTVSYAVGGTATAGSDYAALSRTVVIPAGASSAAITVRPANDTAVEPSETVAVRLVAGSAYAVGASSTATVGIVDDDPITIDNGRTGTSFTGTWLVSSGPSPYGSTSLYSAGAGQDTYRWTPTIPTTRVYEVYAWWTSLPNRSTDVQYRIRHAGGTAVVTRNQRTAGGQWVSLGTFQFNAGTAGYVQVSDVNGAGVSADAIRWMPPGMRPAPSAIPPGGIVIDNGRPGTSFTGQWSPSSGSKPYGGRSLYAAGSGQDTYLWRPTIPRARPYDVYVWWTVTQNRSTNVQYRIVSAQGTTVTTRDQRTGGGQWQYLGTFQFNAGTGGYVQVSDNNGSTVSADAALFVPR